MLLPSNGRILIIDDKENQAMPLILALSKNKIPVSYINAKKETLPASPFDDMRIVFLDYNLNDGPADWETEKSLLIQIIKASLSPGTPYLLFIWSVNELSLNNKVDILFENELISFKPIIKPISLRKDQLFDLVNPETGEYEAASGIDLVAEIEKRINDSLSMIDSLEILIKWEDIIHCSTSEIIKDLINLSSIRDSLNEGVKTILFKLAQAYWGKRLGGLSLDKIAILGLTNLNSLLIDKIEFNISENLELSIFKDERIDLSLQENHKALLNSKLLLSFDKSQDITPGNVYIIEKDKGNKRRIIQDIFDNRTFDDQFLIDLNLVHEEVFNQTNDFNEGYFEKHRNYCNQKIDDIVSKSLYVELEVTAVCDFSQKKAVNHRTLSGIVLKTDFLVHLKKGADFFFLSTGLVIRDLNCVLILDYRFLKGQDIGTLKNAEFLCRIRHLFLNEIQNLLARQISRTGLVYIQ